MCFPFIAQLMLLVSARPLNPLLAVARKTRHNSLFSELKGKSDPALVSKTVNLIFTFWCLEDEQVAGMLLFVAEQQKEYEKLQVKKKEKLNTFKSKVSPPPPTPTNFNLVARLLFRSLFAFHHRCVEGWGYLVFLWRWVKSSECTSFQTQQEIAAFVKDAAKQKHKFKPMDKVYRAIV